MRETVSRRQLFASLAALSLPATANTSKENAGTDRESLIACIKPNNAKGSPLAVDVHCHLFNAKDVPVRGFIAQTVFHDSGHGWLSAPNRLSQLVDFLISKPTPGLQEELDRLELLMTKRHPRFREAYQNAAASSPAENLCLLDTYGAKANESTPPTRRRNQVGYWINYRIDNALQMMNDFPQIDLFLPALVDLDSNIDDYSPTSVSQQVDIMERISAVTHGRFHSYIGFDPARQAMFEAAFGNNGYAEKSRLSPLNIVKNAIEVHGFIGVKLYPPIGFKPIGNDNTDAECRNVSLPNRKSYDSILGRLYEWCEKSEVPILAHCNESNYARPGTLPEKCFELGTPAQWSEVAKRYKNLKICLGHFGRLDEMTENGLDLDRANSHRDYPRLEKFEREDKNNRRKLDELLATVRENANVFGDFSNYTALENEKVQKKFQENLGAWLVQLPKLTSRLMYGSDWSMHAGNFNNYTFPLETSFPREHRAAFMGLNAIEFLGLTKGSMAYKRLMKFYERWNISPDQVPWLAKAG